MIGKNGSRTDSRPRSLARGLGHGDIGIGQLRGRREGGERESEGRAGGRAGGREGGRDGGGESLAVPCIRRRVYAHINATMRSPSHTRARACTYTCTRNAHARGITSVARGDTRAYFVEPRRDWHVRVWDECAGSAREKGKGETETERGRQQRERERERERERGRENSAVGTEREGTHEMQRERSERERADGRRIYIYIYIYIFGGTTETEQSPKKETAGREMREGGRETDSLVAREKILSGRQRRRGKMNAEKWRGKRKETGQAEQTYSAKEKRGERRGGVVWGWGARGTRGDGSRALRGTREREREREREAR